MDLDFKKIDKKWQKRWEESLKIDLSDNKNKFYCLTMFSYPSGSKLHVGHWYNYGPTDSYARFMKMNGYNVFQPQGFDAFGLPAENFAIKHGIHPRESTDSNIKTMIDSDINVIYLNILVRNILYSYIINFYNFFF